MVMMELIFGMVRKMTFNKIVSTMKDQLKEGAIDDLTYVKTLNTKQFNELARQYAKEYIEEK